MYEEWCTKNPVASEFTSYQVLNKCQCDILRFLAEKGLHSVYDLAKELKYRYPYVHKNAEKLRKRQLVSFRKDSSRDRIRKLVELNFRGTTVFLLLWEVYEKEAKRSINSTIDRHSDLYSFSGQWHKIKEIVGEELLHKELIGTAWDIANGKYAKIEIDHLNLKFPAFIYHFIGRLFTPPETDFKGKERNQKIADFLVSQDELKKSYISFLAIQDILDLAEGRLEVDESAKFRSERELAFFEKRDLSTDLLFHRERLREIFPEYAEMKHVFSGSLMNRLLWKTKPTSEEEKGFHFYRPE